MLVTAAVGITTSAVATPTWNTQTQLTASGATTSQAPQFLIGSDGSITAVTVETVNSVFTVLARTSTDGGSTWSSAVALSAAGVASSDVSTLRLSNGTFAVAWAEASGASGANQIRFITSSNNGQSWTQAQTISTAGSNAYPATKPHLAALGAADVVVGFQQSNGSNDIAMVRNSATQLQSWTQAISLSAAGSNATHVTPVANTAGDIVVSWVLVASDTTKQAQVANVGQTPTVTTLSSYAVGGDAKIPVVLALPTGAFVVLWSDPDSPTNPNFAVSARKSIDAGVNWDTAVVVSMAAYPEKISAIVTPDGGIAAAWSMGTGGYTYVETSYSSPTASPTPSPSSSPSSSSSSTPTPAPTLTGAGTAWLPPTTITPTITGQYYFKPQLTLSPDGTVGMTLIQNVNSAYSPGFALSTDNGASWPQGVGSISSWLSAPTSVGDVSVSALAGQGFIFGWQTLSNSNPGQGFARVYGWVGTSSPSSSTAPTLPATGVSMWIPGLLSIAFFGSGLIFWHVTARSRSRR